MTKLIASVGCLCLLALVATAGGSKDAKVEGTWIATAGISDGKEVPKDIIAKINLTLVIKEGKYSVSVDGKEVEAGKYKIDTSKKPALLDLTIGKGKDEGKTQVGIVQVDGDTMQVALGPAGKKDRPKNFEGGPEIEVTTLKRKK
jgi:uncharacterized protein (TIGR03067 family)